jgi:hypothetical protein
MSTLLKLNRDASPDLGSLAQSSVQTMVAVPLDPRSKRCTLPVVARGISADSAPFGSAPGLAAEPAWAISRGGLSLDCAWEAGPTSAPANAGLLLSSPLFAPAASRRGGGEPSCCSRPGPCPCSSRGTDWRESRRSLWMSSPGRARSSFQPASWTCDTPARWQFRASPLCTLL